MHRAFSLSLWTMRILGVVGGCVLLLCNIGGADPVPPKSTEAKDAFPAVVQPILKKFCLDCHSTKAKKGSLDLERFASLDHIRKDVKPWQQMIELLEAGEMPPKDRLQPSDEERKRLIAWVRGFLDAEAHARIGDPGHVPLRRLSNAEYDVTIRDLTGVDLRPTREFPADGAAGEGFTNAAEALSDISPTLLTKYLNAAKDISEHAVLLPDGFQFSLSKTRRDWTDESVARLRKFYAAYCDQEGRLPFQPYLAATVRYREALTGNKIALAEVAAKEKLNPKYLGILWQTLTDRTPSPLLDSIRERWRRATEKDVGALNAEIAAWQATLWKVVAIGSYRSPLRQLANNPPAIESQTLKLAVKPLPGQNEVVLYLQNRDLAPGSKEGRVLWYRPRFEGSGKPTLLLKDYPTFGSAYEVDFSLIFAETAKYLAAVLDLSRNPKTTIDDLAKTTGLDKELLKRWVEVTALEPMPIESADPEKQGKVVPAIPLQLLNEKITNERKPALTGWVRKGSELPILLTNSSDAVEIIPGKMSPHRVAVHPSPKEFAAVTWKSPVSTSVSVAARVMQAHPACGNGVAWRLEHRRGEKARVWNEGVVEVGKEVQIPAKAFKVEKGDVLILAVDARNGDHRCDLTEIDLTVTEAENPKRVWNLTADIADTVLAGNPHADKFGNPEVWSFVKGASASAAKSGEPTIPPQSILGRWRESVSTGKPVADLALTAELVQALLKGPRPAKEKDPDRILYDYLVSSDSPLLKGLDPARFAKPHNLNRVPYGLSKERFGGSIEGKPVDEASLLVEVDTVTEIHLPAALFRDREFVVEGKSAGNTGSRVVQFQVRTTPPASESRWDGKSPVVTAATGTSYRQLLRGYDDFRKVFPQFIAYSRVIPNDETVSLKMYHREEEPLVRLFLDDEQNRRLDYLWLEHRFIGQQPVAENNYLPQFIGFVTQDQPKELLAYFEAQREPFRKRAEEFEKDVVAAIPKQLDVLIEFAARAYRRPLLDKEKADLRELYQAIRAKGAPHGEAFRGVLARVLVSPAFLFRIEQSPTGTAAKPVNDWELAARLSYFLWSSAPDAELHRLAAAGQLHDPNVLAGQAERMLKDEHIRALAVEFGTQWLHVRGFDEFNEKNEKLFPTFDPNLRKAIYEESILFFKDLFQNDRTIHQVLDSDATYLNEILAKHYGIPGVAGPQWRRVEGVKKYGRGGILGLASIQAKQSGASRTSPVLRGNWVVETLLGEKLPRPPANVPKLPEEEGGADHLTVRQQVEKHASQPECMVCHQRIDPFGFALEKYDAIGRRRDKDLGGLAVDAQAKLKDGTAFEGIEGLRTYLQTKKNDVIVRLFCRKLLGYALGRAVTLSDQSLIEEMVAELNKNEGRLSAAVLTIVRSPQFRMIRGNDNGE